MNNPQTTTASSPPITPKSQFSSTKIKTTNWVKFDEENQHRVDEFAKNKQNEVEVKVNGESVCARIDLSQSVTLNQSVSTGGGTSNTTNTINTSTSPTVITSPPSSSSPVPPTVREHENGDILVSLFPVNETCDWFTPARFKPNLVPEELMSTSLSLTVEDYVTAITMLTNDYRFNLFIIFYKRIMMIWIITSVLLLLLILFSGMIGAWLFISAMSWVLINSMSIFIVLYLKNRMAANLEKCFATVNRYLHKHNILIGMDDVGEYSCHKINLIFVYFKPNECIGEIKLFLANNDWIVTHSSAQQTASVDVPSTAHLTWNNTMTAIDTNDILITGNAPRSIPQKEVRINHYHRIKNVLIIPIIHHSHRIMLNVCTIVIVNVS